MAGRQRSTSLRHRRLTAGIMQFKNIYRTRDHDTVADAIKDYRYMTGDGDLGEWLLNEDHYAFMDEVGNLGIIRKDRDGLFDSHIFFKSRGREAYKKAVDMMMNAFDNYDVKIMRGYTPLYNKAARWMNRQLGYTSYGPLPDLDPPCELFIVTKDEFYTKHGVVNE